MLNKIRVTDGIVNKTINKGESLPEGFKFGMTRHKKQMRVSDNDLQDILVNPKLNNRGQYVCDCPFCGKDKHFYISKARQQWDCKKCNEFGGIWKLLNHLGKLYLLEGETVEYTEKLKTIAELKQEEQTEEDVKLEELPRIKMPVGWRLYEKCDYLKGRGITAQDIKRYNFGYTKLLSKFENYVLIPVYDNGKIRGYLGRYANKKVPKESPRYNNSSGTDFSKLLFGYDEITANTKTVILVEGVFDKIAVDKILKLWDSEDIKCCVTFGHKISPYQMAKLRHKNISNVVLLFDYDAIKEIKKYSFDLEKYFFTNIVFTVHKDIDECPRNEALEIFDNLYRPMEFYGNVIGKISKK